MAVGQGTVVFNFGAAPGSNVAITSVPDETITATAKCELYLMGTDSTATHNTTEHQLLPLGGLSIQCTSITEGVGFTAQAATLLRLTGTFQARYVWTD
jgi:hypothetical protein